jgi:hypothetical protein
MLPCSEAREETAASSAGQFCAMRLDEIIPLDSNSDLCRIVIETPRGCRHKYAFDRALNGFLLKKSLPQGMVFPFDFGFMPRTRGGAGSGYSRIHRPLSGSKFRSPLTRSLQSGYFSSAVGVPGRPSTRRVLKRACYMLAWTATPRDALMREECGGNRATKTLARPGPHGFGSASKRA